MRPHLPSGVQLPESEHTARHRLIVWVLVALMSMLSFVGALHEYSALELVAAIGLVIGLPTLLAWKHPNRRFRTVAAAWGLMAAAATLVHLWNGRIEAHFLFFVLLPLVALYQDWLPFIVALAVVIGHHAVMGTLHPGDVFDHPPGQGSPMFWASIHSLFIAALIGVLIIYWNAAESGQRALTDTVNELQTTQLHLVQAQKLESVGVLAAGVAHEINTPIQFIGDNLRFLQTSFQELFVLVGVLDALVEASRPMPQMRELVQHVDAECETDDLDYLLAEIPLAVSQSLDGIERVAEIVRALTGVAHPSDERCAADINGLIGNTVIVTRNEWRHDALLRTDLDPQLPELICAAGPLSQVVVNMIVNAAHAIRERFGQTATQQGEIVVTTRRVGDAVRICVADNGCGIPEDIRSRVFDPFFTTKVLGKGTGQGLAISYAVIVTQHGGTITVDSVPGEGTRFIIDLPLFAT